MQQQCSKCAASFVACCSRGLMQHFAAAALEQAGRMGTGETVLVTAAAGGTGQFAVQLAKAAGNTVIATCSSQEKADMLRGLGADRVINYKTEQLGKVGSALCKRWQASKDSVLEAASSGIIILRSRVGFPSCLATSKAALGSAYHAHLYRRAAVQWQQGWRQLPLGPA